MTTTRAPIVDDITLEALEDDPYPVYARLRREAPVCFVPAVGLWFVTRWEDVEFGASHPELFPATVVDSPLDRTLGGSNVLTVEGEDHEGFRAPLDRALRPRVLEKRAPGIVQAIADELLDDLAPRGSADLLVDYFEPLSTRSLSQVIGLGDIEAPTLARWFHGLAAGTSNYERDASKQQHADQVSDEIDRALWPLLERRPPAPEDTMIAFLLEAAPGDVAERLRWVMPTLKLVLIGGLQEPGHGLASTVYGLLSTRGQAEEFAADPAGLVAKAVDEGLRWISPIGTQARASAAATIGGITVPEGDNVAFMVPSANRDEEVWGPTAADFDLHRPRHPHAAFGFGPHFCVGHYLARIQMRIGLRSLFERLPGLSLVDDHPVTMRGWEYRSPTHLTARWDV